VPSLSGILVVASEPPHEINKIIGPILRFDKSNYILGRAKEIVPTGSHLLFVDMTEGMVYTKGGQINRDKTVWREGDDPLPPRGFFGELDPAEWEIDPFDESGKRRRDPYQHQFLLYFRDLQTDKYLTFITSSGGGHIAVRELAGAISVFNKQRGIADGFPEVSLEIDKWDSGKCHNIPRPAFRPFRWRDAEGSTLPELGPVIDGAVFSVEAGRSNDSPWDDAREPSSSGRERASMLHEQ
jgi:hypothetical protein